MHDDTESTHELNWLHSNGPSVCAIFTMTTLAPPAQFYSYFTQRSLFSGPCLTAGLQSDGKKWHNTTELSALCLGQHYRQ